ncbi:hypothetical protein [Mycolicibacterium moriokaense]|uniref:Uncharacterized protein n=1 Tax=Mycolicibacterium moriokaense TaxID=39691 RepID=A0A318H883_9MYCO|nr:hypothetical protein [Mycolicibacterium moriokaense]PXX01493.1 hypothetical protein C8E89_12956 [Mycolicibacterium moriokaense]
MKIRGPIVTLAAVAALGVGILLVNMSKEESAPAASPYRQSTTTAAAATPVAPAPVPPPAPPAAAFPAKADYVGKIPTAKGTITLDITIEGDKAVAYACDGNSIESWLRGSATGGALSLASKDKTGRLEGKLEGNAVVGTLWIGDKKWEFKADPAQPPAGLYVYDNAGVRNSWIIDGNGGVTGVQRRPDGSTAPAPGLSIDRTAVIDGQTIVATRVEGASDV